MVLDTSCLEQLPFWNDLLPSEKALVHSKARITNFKKDKLVRRNDRPCPGMIFVLAGKVRAYIISPEGREITLFYLEKGESCVFSAACVLKHIACDTFVKAVSDVRILNVGPRTFDVLQQCNLHVRCFSYELATARFSTALWVMQEIVFTRFDKRLARLLLTLHQKTGSTELHLKQEDLACRINAPRESVARMLRHFASDGFIVCRRACIRLEDLEALQKIAS